MRRLIAVVLAAASAGTGAAPPSDLFSDHRWRHRLLLLYVPAADVPALERFRARVHAGQCGIDERDLLIGEIIGMNAGSLAGEPLSADHTRDLRRDHRIELNDVTTVLIGKDGGIKLRVQGVADLERVFERIDGMPMRRQEMVERGAKACD